VTAASTLVVDDDAPIRRTLAAERRDVSAAADGGAALAAVERAVPGLRALHRAARLRGVPCLLRCDVAVE
jgi:CheY-like chemotaxis protein